MEIILKKEEFFFKGEIILDNIEEIKLKLSNLINKIKTNEIKLNLNDVLELDSAGIQMIFSFCKTLKMKNIGYSVSSINEEIQHILRIAGLGKYLNL